MSHARSAQGAGSFQSARVEIDKLNRLLDLTSEAIAARDRYESVLRDKKGSRCDTSRELRRESDRLFNELEDVAQELRRMVADSGSSVLSR